MTFPVVSEGKHCIFHVDVKLDMNFYSYLSSDRDPILLSVFCF